MQMLTKRFALVVVATSLAALPGCGGDGPVLYPVEGTIKKNGEPMAEVAVIYVPDSPQGHNAASQAITGPDGKYYLTTDGRTGAPAGKYRVSLSKAPAPADVPEAFKDDPSMAAMAPTAPSRKKKAEKVEQFEKLIENVEVAAGDNKGKDFDVADQSAAAATP